MNLGNLRNSIRHSVLMHDPEDVKGIVDSVFMLFICELWTHTSKEVLYVDSLTDQEFRILSHWAIMSRDSYSSKIAHIKDMREVFPGLSLTAAAQFCGHNVSSKGAY